ncbi:MAG: hypothetical protein D3916_16360 [Candidatus Electrothrix sp. MAN1_4]|nr:hypothetical protein [Candidatus Electrothrix sp. MAN1_4]
MSFSFSTAYNHPTPGVFAGAFPTRQGDMTGQTGHIFTQPQYEAFSRTPAQTSPAWTASHPAKWK